MSPATAVTGATVRSCSSIAGSDDVSSVDDVDDAGEVLEDRRVEIAVVVADDADADRGG